MRQYSFLQEANPGTYKGAAVGALVGGGLATIATVMRTKDKFLFGLATKRQDLIDRGEMIKAHKVEDHIERVRAMSPMKFRAYMALKLSPAIITGAVIGSNIGSKRYSDRLSKTQKAERMAYWKQLKGMRHIRTIDRQDMWKDFLTKQALQK